MGKLCLTLAQTNQMNHAPSRMSRGSTLNLLVKTPFGLVGMSIACIVLVKVEFRHGVQSAESKQLLPDEGWAMFGWSVEKF